MQLFNETAHLALAKALEAASLRQRVIADNIANLNTPGFKRSEVRFEELLRKAIGGREQALPLRRTDPRHFGGAGNLETLTPKAEQVRTTSMRADGNNVDLDQEMVALATNTIAYRAAAQMLSDRLAKLSFVINGGR